MEIMKTASNYHAAKEAIWIPRRPDILVQELLTTEKPVGTASPQQEAPAPTAAAVRRPAVRPTTNTIMITATAVIKSPAETVVLTAEEHSGKTAVQMPLHA